MADTSTGYTRERVRNYLNQLLGTIKGFGGNTQQMSDSGYATKLGFRTSEDMVRGFAEDPMALNDLIKRAGINGDESPAQIREKLGNTEAAFKGIQNLNGNDEFDAGYAEKYKALTDKEMSPEQRKAQAEQQQAEADNAVIGNKLKAYANEMNLPVDELLKRGDSLALATRDMGFNQASRQNQAQGIEGTGAQRNAMQGTKNALLGFQGQRQQMGLQALGMAGQQQNAVQGLALQRAQMAAEMDQRNQQAQQAQSQAAFEQNQGRGQQIGSAIGTGIGVLGAGIASFASAGGAAPFAPAIISGAGALGGAIGGGAGNGFRPYSPPAYRPSSTRGYGLSGGGNS